MAVRIRTRHLVMALLVLCGAAPLVPNPAHAATPAIRLAPDRGGPGTTLDVHGSGYDCDTATTPPTTAPPTTPPTTAPPTGPPPSQAAGDIALLWDGTTRLGSAPVDGNGTFVASVTVPGDAPAGWHYVSGTCRGGSTSAGEWFLVTTFGMKPSAGAPRQAFTVTADGLPSACAKPDLWWDGRVIPAEVAEQATRESKPRPYVSFRLVTAVPADAPPGTHVVSLACRGLEVGWVELARAPFQVIAGSVPAGVAVPDLIGMPVTQARGALSAAGLVPAGPLPADGRVVGQDPPAGTVVARGSAVRVAVSRTAVVPDLHGMAPADAGAALRRAGLVAAGALPEAGRVIGQDPAPGTVVPAGSAVTVVVSRTVVVPDLTGMTAGEAREALEATGLLLAGNGTGGRVRDQDPAPGATVPVGTEVTVLLSGPPALTAVARTTPGMAAVLLLLAGVFAVTHLARGRQARRAVPVRVRAVTVPGAPWRVDVLDLDPPGSTRPPVLRMRARRRAGPPVLQEVFG